MNNNRGSLTIIAIFTVLIFSLYGILLYARSASSYNRQTKSIEKIQQIYAQDVPNAATIAEQLGASYEEIYDENAIGTLVKKGKIEVGDWINYYTNNETKYKTTREDAGISQTIYPDQTVKWRVWEIKSNRSIVITPCYEDESTSRLKLQGAVGYLNGPELIHNACKALYINNSLGISGEDIVSMTIEDIESKAYYDKNTYTNGNVQYGHLNSSLYTSGTFIQNMMKQV